MNRITLWMKSNGLSDDAIILAYLLVLLLIAILIWILVSPIIAIIISGVLAYLSDLRKFFKK